MTKTTAPVHKTMAMPHSTERYFHKRTKRPQAFAIFSAEARKMSDDAYFRIIASSLGLGMLLAFALLVGLSFPGSELPRDLAAGPGEKAAEALAVMGKLQSR